MVVRQYGTTMGKMQAVSRRKQRNSDAETFGAILRRIRSERGLTQERLAELAELNVSYIGFLERGENVPTLTIVLNLADALDVDAADLVREVARSR
jgi:transcriptional regulator with XRE-family HTH domain